MEVLMRTYILAIAIAALFAIPTTAFSESINVGHGGVTIGPPSYGHHRLYNVTKASTIATKANGAENCDQLACTKKN
jgi:hypothetical protein